MADTSGVVMTLNHVLREEGEGGRGRIVGGGDWEQARCKVNKTEKKKRKKIKKKKENKSWWM